MALIVALTGAAGLLASFVLLRVGIDAMALRYPLALAAAYLVFLAMLWLWLRTQASDYGDVPDPGLGDLDLGPVGDAAAWPPLRSGGGGDFGGGGAEAGFDAPLRAAAELPRAGGEAIPIDGGGGASGSWSSLGDAAGAVGDADEAAIPLLAVALALGLALASLYVVYVAPVLFAELLLDGALSYTLYRRLRGVGDGPHWLVTALRRTVLPFALTALFLAAVGAALTAWAPGARTLGEALHGERR